MNIVDKYNLQQAELLVKNCKNLNKDLVNRFSAHALIEIGKDVVENNANCDFSLLVPKYLAELRSQFQYTHEEQKELLQNYLEDDCEYSPEMIAKMTPRQKVKNWLEWNGIQGFTDDILDVVSAAYGIILEPDLNR